LQARKNFSDAPKMEHANLTENTNSHLDRGMNKAGRAAIFGLMAQFRPALITGCILHQNLLTMAQDFWRSRPNHGK